jgi:hypothetical protein
MNSPGTGRKALLDQHEDRRLQRREHQQQGREGGWLGEGLARWLLLRFQPLPVEPCMRFSRTRLTDVLHRRCSTGARQGRFGLGAMTVPLREISPRLSGER